MSSISEDYKVRLDHHVGKINRYKKQIRNHEAKLEALNAGGSENVQDIQAGKKRIEEAVLKIDQASEAFAKANKQKNQEEKRLLHEVIELCLKEVGSELKILGYNDPEEERDTLKHG